MSCSPGAGSTSFLLEFAPNSPDLYQQVSKESSLSTIFETGNSYTQTFEEELFIHFPTFSETEFRIKLTAQSTSATYHVLGPM